ncbi:cytoplasmic tRNA 2-thiolation protein 1 [Guaruba guarouba]
MTSPDAGSAPRALIGPRAPPGRRGVARPLRIAVHAGKALAACAAAPRLRRTRPLPTMPPPRCHLCPLPASLLRPRCGTPLCRRCFVRRFEAELLRSITAAPGSRAPVPAPGSTVAVAASGGKDSTVLSHLLRRFAPALGLRLALVSVDEGIAGYREAALEAVRGARGGAPLLVLSHRELFGWSVDEVAAALGPGSRCTFCGVLRRQALERAARLLGADCIATGRKRGATLETGGKGGNEGSTWEKGAERRKRGVALETGCNVGNGGETGCNVGNGGETSETGG